MVPDLLISWRVLAHMAVSSSPSQTRWMAECNKTLSIHVCIYSYWKVAGEWRMEIDTNTPHRPGTVDAFIKQFLPPEALEYPTIVTPAVYYQIKRKFGEDNLEIFAIALALMRNYTYVCLDQDEAAMVKNNVPQLKIALITDFLDATKSLES